MPRKLVNEYLDVFIIMLAFAGMIFSHALMSFSLAFMAARFLFANKQRLKETRKDLLLALLSYFALMLIASLWSENLNEAVKQLNKNLPFLIVPLYFFTINPLDKKKIITLAVGFVSFLIVSSLIALTRLYFFDYNDIRQALPVGSHIRFSLFVCLTIGFAGIYWFKHRKEIKTSHSLILIAVIVYLLAYIILSSSLTAIVILFVLLLPTSLIYVRKRISKTLFYIYLFLVCSSAALLGNYIYSCANDYFVPKEAANDTLLIENGYYCYTDDATKRQQQEEQMARGMQQYLNISKDSLFQDGEYQYSYLDIACRYFNSKGLERNLQNWNLLTQEDKENIRNGIPNYVYASGNPLKVRLYKTFYGIEAFRVYGKVKGSSIIQKLELWDKAISLSKDELVWLCGVGTGDLIDELNIKLKENNSQMTDCGLRPHNQFLTTWITFGLIGLGVFLVMLFYPAFSTKLYKNSYYICFMAIILISMLSEDTLDNQQGILLFCVLNSFFISLKAIKS